DRQTAGLASGESLSRDPGTGSARDLRLFRQDLPGGLPVRQAPAERVDQAPDLVGERPADLVVVAVLEAELPVDAVLRAARAPEDVHGPHVPLLEGALGLVPGGRAIGQPLDPELAVAGGH